MPMKTKTIKAYISTWGVIDNNGFEVALEHINCFVVQPGNIENIDFIIIYKWFQFFRNFEAAE